MQKDVQDNTRNIRISFDALRSGALALQVLSLYSLAAPSMLTYADL